MASPQTEHGNIDVKIAKPQLSKYYSRTEYVFKYKRVWKFNCHHHGIKQDNVDIFIFVVCDYVQNNLYFIVPSIIINRNFVISERQLKNGTHDYFLSNWKIIKNFPKKKLSEIHNYLIRSLYCIYCGNIILNGNKKYCNEICKEKNHNEKYKVELICAHCKKKYSIGKSKYRAKTKERGYKGNYYCSRRCFLKVFKGKYSTPGCD